MQTLILSCFLVSGATGLVYEVLWGKYLGLFIGSTAYAHAVVLATFMGGLALGNALLGRVADRAPRKLVLYGALEMGIGLLCLLFPLLYRGLALAYHVSATADPGSAPNLVYKVVLAALAILPPTVLMGGTLPALTRAIVRTMADAGSRVGLLYFINSAGAAAGCLLAGFWLVPALGLDAATVATALLNVAIGGLFLLLGRSEAPAAATQPQSPPASPQPCRYSDAQVRWVYAIILASGIVSMLYELVWIRLLTLVLGSSTYSFSVMLFTFIGGIAIGGALSALLLRRPRDDLRLLGLCELAVFASLLLMVPVYERLPYWFNRMAAALPRAEPMFGLYQAFTVAVCFAAMVLPTTFIGMTLPLASRAAARGVPVLGRTVGSVFSANTLGNVVGSLLTGFVLIPALGLQMCLEAGILASGLLGAAALAVAAPQAGPVRRWLPAAAVLALAVFCHLALPRWNATVLNAGVFRMRQRVASSYAAFTKALGQQRLLFLRDGPDASVAVGHPPQHPEYLWLNINGKADASTFSDLSSQLLVAHIPLLLAPRCDSVLVVGLGSGVSAGAVVQHPVKHCDVVEISRAVVAGSRFFDRVSGAPLADPRMHLTVADAKEFLQLQPGRRYDVVISEPTNPWIAGVGNLFSREFFADVTRHLRPEGLFTQWVHVYEMNDSVLAVALNTLSSVFPYVSVWHPQANDLVILASLQPQQVRFPQLEQRLALPGVRRQLTHPFVVQKVTDVTTFLSLQVLSNGAFKQLFPGRPPYNSDLHPYLEYHAPAAFFAGSTATLLDRDERLRCAAGSRLFIAPWLLSHPPDRDEVRSLIGQLAPGLHRSEKRMLHGLVYAYMDRFDDDTAGVPDRERRLLRMLDERTGSQALALKVVEWSRKIRTSAMSVRDWRDYRAFEAEALQATANVFVEPDVSRFEYATDQCASLLPQEARRFEELKSGLYRQLGIAEQPPTRKAPAP